MSVILVGRQYYWTNSQTGSLIADFAVLALLIVEGITVTYNHLFLRRLDFREECSQLAIKPHLFHSYSNHNGWQV